MFLARSVTLPSGSDRPPAVWVDDLWVSFRVTREKNQTLKGTLAGMRDRSKQSMLIEALRGVSFQVPAGSVYGVIGRNGAGKIHLAAHDRRDPAAHRRPRRGVGPGHAAAVVGRRFQPRAHRAREHPARRAHRRAHRGRGVRELRRGRGVRRARRRDRLPDAHVLVGHVRPPRVLGGRAPAARDPAHRRGARRGRRRVQAEVDGQDRRALRAGLHRADRLARPRGREGAGRGLRLARPRDRALEGPADEVVAAYMAEEHIEATSATALEDV